MKKVSTHLQYFWWSYVLVAVLAIFIWTSVFSSLAKPKDNEKIVVSYFGADYDFESMHKDLNEDISNITDQYIEEVSFAKVSDANDSMLYQLIQTRLYTSDIMIFTDDIATDDLIKANFRPLSKDAISKYFSDETSVFDFYSVNDNIYGVYLNFEGKPTNRFSKYYTGTKKCIAVFSHESANVASIYDKGNVEDDAAISALKYLLEVMPDVQA